MPPLLGRRFLRPHVFPALVAFALIPGPWPQTQRLVPRTLTKSFCAVQYIEDPLLINSRKFGIRVWALVTCTDPLRVYLHERGLVLFSDEPFAGNEGAGEDGEDPGGVAGGHVTNYAQNRDGDVWDLEQLRAHLGEDGYQRVHQVRTVGGWRLAGAAVQAGIVSAVRGPCRSCAPSAFPGILCPQTGVFARPARHPKR